MKAKKISLAIITFIMCFISVFAGACGKDYIEVGVPYAETFPNGEIARNLWDLYIYDGKIYLGGGDYSLNSGPVDIFAYDLAEEKFVLTGSVEDEAIVNFVQIGEKFIATGTDPMEDWSMGNFYVLTSQGWEKQRVLPFCVHNFDLIEFEGKIYAGMGGDYGHNPIAVSTDGGLTFEEIPLYLNGQEILALDDPEYCRCYSAGGCPAGDGTPARLRPARRS